MKGESTQPVRVRSEEVSGRLGSYPGDGEGDRTIEAPGTKVRFGRASKCTGRNASEAWAGLESLNAGAESPLNRRRPSRSTRTADMRKSTCSPG